jgi:aconitate hydratase
VLPLEFRHPADSRAITAGDELEIPSLPGALESGKALNVRNLTRGTQLALGHGLDPRRIQIVRAGGLLALAALEAPGTTARSRV